MLTPKMHGVVERMARARQPALHTLTPAEAKAAYEKGAGVLEVPRPDLPRVQDLVVPARDGIRYDGIRGNGLPVRRLAGAMRPDARLHRAARRPRRL